MPPISVLLCPVPFFLNRGGLTYPELVALVKTRFVNPQLQGQGDLDYLARLGITPADLRPWIQAGFPVLPASLDEQLKNTNTNIKEFTAWVKDRQKTVVLNSAFEDPCDLDRTTLMHLDGSLLSPDELVTLFRFIRLWRKIGWTLDEMDLALEPGSFNGSTAFNSILLLANLKQLRDTLQLPVADIVCLWRTIPTHGETPRYDQLFRNRAAQLLVPILELNKERSELQAAGASTPPKITDHLPPLLAAFQVSARDFELLRKATGLADDMTATMPVEPSLTLPALSLLYCHIVLAHALNLSIPDLLSLIEFTALDPFERPDRMPRGAALQFVEIVKKVESSGVKPEELDYLLREVPQPPALPGAQRQAWKRSLSALLDGLRGIAAEEPVEDDPSGEQLTARLTVLLGPENARTAVDLVYGLDVYSTPLAGLPPGFAFPASVQGKASYDANRKQLRFHGAMTPKEQSDLLGVTATPPAPYVQAVKIIAAQPRAFVVRALAPMFPAAEAETILIDNSSLRSDGTADRDAIDKKIDSLLKRRKALLSRSLVKQTFSSDTGLPAEIVALLLENEAVLKALRGISLAMDDYLSLEGDGLSGTYFAVPNLTGIPVLQRTDPSIVFDWQTSVPGPGLPLASFSVLWRGSLYVPAAGQVIFQVSASDGIRLRVADKLIIDEWRNQPLSLFSASLRLDGGQFYPLEVEYYNQTGNAQVQLSWSSPSIPAGAVPSSALYTPAPCVRIVVASNFQTV